MAEDEERLDALISQLSDANKDKHVRALRFHTKETLDFLAQIKSQVKQIPHFWRTALLNHSVIAHQASLSADVDALGYLTDIELKQDVNDPRPYEIIFHFDSNPYFSNSTLSKKYTLPKDVPPAPEDGAITDDLRVFESDQLVPSSCKIDWKEGQDLCAKHPRAVNSEEDGEFDGDPGSFFWFFTSESDPFSLGNTILQDILPDPVIYYENEGEMCENDDYDSEDEEDEEDEDEIDLEEEDDPPKKKQRTTNGV